MSEASLNQSLSNKLADKQQFNTKLSLIDKSPDCVDFDVANMITMTDELENVEIS